MISSTYRFELGSTLIRTQFPTCRHPFLYSAGGKRYPGVGGVSLPLTKDVFRQVLPRTKPLTPPPSHATPEVRRVASYCGIALIGETEYRGPRSGIRSSL